MINETSSKPYLLFDFDGTIADSLPHLIATYHNLAAKYQLKEVTDQEILAWRSKNAFEILRLTGVSVFKVLPLIAEGKRLFGQRIADIRPIPGIIEALQQLSRTHQLGIITSNSTENVEAFLARHRLTMFQFIRSDKTVFGKADIIKKVLSEYAIAPTDAVYVGDEIRDIHAARRSGIPCISVSWGLNTRESLLHHKPNHIVDSPAELVAQVAE
jgi:phosphoglycolate phosphatase